MNKTIKIKVFFFISLWLITSAPPVYPQSSTASSPVPPAEKARLVQAVMCEGVENYAPVNPAIVFSMGNGKISCFTAFDPVPEDMFIYHTWFHQGRMVTRKKLSLKSPKWDTFSSIQLREMDKGPWFIEISDLNDTLFKILRFSVTD